MNTDNGKIGFEVTLDTQQLKRETTEVRGQFQRLSDQVLVDTQRMDSAMRGLGSTIASLGLAFSMQEFAKKVFDVRSEIQKLQVSFSTLIGSAQKGNALFNQIKEFAVKTPMQLNELASAAQMMLSFNIPEDDIMRYLKALGDISMGDSQKFQSLSLAFSQMSSAGKLMGQDLMQMINAGFNPLAVMSEKTGRSIAELKDEMSKGAISAEMVQQAFIDATSEGGKFHGMLEAQSGTLAGAFSNLQGAIDDMFNAIGEDSEGVITSAIEGATFLVKHYETVGNILMTLITSYGVYKATLMAVHAVNTLMYNQEMAAMQAILAKNTVAVDADLKEAVAKGHLTQERALEIQAIRAELQAKMEEAVIADRVAQAAYAEALAKAEGIQVQLSLSRMKVAACREEYNAALMSGNAEQIAAAKTKLAAAAKQHNALASQSSAAKIKLNKAAIDAETASQNRNRLAQDMDTLSKKKNSVATTLLTAVTKGLKVALNAVKAAWATNPIGLIMTAVTMALGALMTLEDATEDAAEASERFGENAVKQIRNVETLIAVISNTRSDSKVHKNAVEELIKVYEDYGIQIDKTVDINQQLIDKKRELVAVMKEEGEEVQKANLIASFDDAKEEAVKNLKSKVKEFVTTNLGDLLIQSEISYDKDEIERCLKMYKNMKDNAEEVSILISGIAQSHDNTEDALEHIAQVLTDTYNLPMKETDKWNEDFIDYLNKFYDNTEALNEQQLKLAKSVDDVIREVAPAGAEIDYAATEFEKLFNAACHANEEIIATKANLDRLGKNPVKPEIDTTSVDNAFSKVNALLVEMAKLQGMEIPYGVDEFSYVVNKKKNDAAHKRLKESQDSIEARMKEALQTRKGTADMLKEVNTLLDTAPVGSDREKKLLAYQKRLQDQQKKFNPSGSGKGGGHGKSPEEIAADIEKAEIRVNELIEQSQQEREQMVHTYEMNRLKNDIALEKDAAERRQKQLMYDQQNEKDQLDRQLQQDIKAEISRQKALFDAKEDEKKARNSKYVKKNFTEDDIDNTEIEKIKERYKTLEEDLAKIQAKAKADLIRADLSDLRKYLTNYGTYQQQKLAIAKEYAEKIRNAQSDGERLSLEKERDAKIADMRSAQIKENIDWSGVFGEFGGMFSDYLQPILDDAKEYLNTDDFKQSSQDSQKAMLEAIYQMEMALGSADAVSFAELGKSIEAYQQAQDKVTQAEAEYAEKYERYEITMEQYQTAIEECTESEQEAAKKIMEEAQAEVLASEQNLKELQTNATKAQQTVSNTARTLKEGIDGVFSGLSSLASGGVKSSYEGFMQLGTSLQKLKLGDKFDKFSKSFGELTKKIQNVPIVGAIMELLDTFKDGVGIVISGMIDAVFSAITNILNDVLNFKDGLFTMIGKAIAESVLNITKSLLTLGGWLDWISTNDKHYERDMERLTASNEALQKALDHLSEVMEDVPVKYADETYKHQMDIIDETEKNTQEQMKRSGKIYNNGFLGIGGAHSTNRKINKGMEEDDWDTISRIVGKTVKNAEDFWGLSSAQMKKLAEESPKTWGKIKDLADDGYKNAAQYMDDYIEFEEKRIELQKAYFEKLTSHSFDDLRSTFKDALTDMSLSAKDFTNDFNKMLVDSISEALMTEKYDPLIKGLYNKWASFMEDGHLSDNELAQLSRDRENIYNSMQQDREFLKSLTGDSNSEQGSSRGFATASQDSIDELNGRFTAIQLDTSAIRLTLTDINDTMLRMNLSAEQSRQIMSDICNISLRAIGHLETISKNTNELYEINERLGKIEKNTKNL